MVMRGGGRRAPRDAGRAFGIGARAFGTRAPSGACTRGSLHFFRMGSADIFPYIRLSESQNQA
jgi:hypothetical protein